MKTIFKKILNADNLLLLSLGFALSFMMAMLFIFQPLFLQLIDYKIYDQLLKMHHTKQASDIPVIVDIDERSLAEYGQFPWPRHRVAMLLAKINKAGALATGLDIMFSEPDRTSPDVLQQQLEEELDVHIDYIGLPEGLRNNDKVLANVLKTGPFVLGYNFIFSREKTEQQRARAFNECVVPPARISSHAPLGAMDMQHSLHKALDVVCPLPVLTDAARRSGFFTMAPDRDGVVRRVPLLIAWNNKEFSSLAVATLMEATKAKGLLLKLDARGTQSLKLAHTIIPLDQKGQMLLNYRGPAKTYKYISAADILKDRIKPGELNGKIVFIGTSASGLKDIRTTPFDQNYPGVEAHATIVDNIISKDFISIPDWVPGLEFFLILFAGISITVILIWTKALWVAILLLVLSFGIWQASTYAFTDYRIYVSPLYTYLVLFVNFLALTLLKFWREEKQKKFIHGAFSHYLAPTVISQIIDDPDSLTLEGQEKEVTILFSDVRSFTSLSEKLTPTQVTNLLHDYLTPMTRIITENSGTLDKFIGDAVMAFWNAPLDVENHQSKAVHSALAQLEQLGKLNKIFADEYGFGIRIGLGVHCGMVRVGNMGSADLFDYTLIGDNVNLASRLEGLTKYYGQDILVSEAIAKSCQGEFVFTEIDSVRVKGKVKPINIYTVHSHERAERYQEELSAYTQGLEEYKGMNFKLAAEIFNELQDEYPEKGLYSVYCERCRHLAANPPDKDWDGVFTHKTK